MHVALLFPSGTDPRSPHLSLPSLAAHLRAHDVRVTVRDLDVEGLHWLLRPDRLAVAADRCRTDVAAGSAVGALLPLADWIVEHTADALDDLRRLETFLDPDRAHQARATVSAATRLVSAASSGVTYSATHATYDVAGVDATRLGDLLAVTADPAAHLFEDLVAGVIGDDLARDRPDLVAVSILNRQQAIPGLTLARRLRAAGHRVVLGGTVYAKFHDRLIDRPSFFDAFCDALVPYEGETALLAIAERVDGTEPDRPLDLAGVPNTLWVGPSGRVVAGPTHVEDVRSLPTPDFEGMPLDLYLNPVPVLPILTGKGCYFNRCKFCDIPFINEISVKPYRVRDPEQIALDIATLHERHGARHFEITDETLSPKLLLRLADALDAYPDIEPRFVGYARFEPGFTAEACARIHEMGMRKLFFGLESGNQAMLDHMDKGVTVADARQVLRHCDDAGLATHVFSIVGFPEETEQQARDTLAFLLDEHASLAHPRHTFDVHPFGLDLRTDYGDNPARYGITFDGPPDGGTDFPITLRGWRNNRGLSPDDVDRLIAEFAAALRDRYRGSRRYPDQQWPGFEEYAVVYGDQFAGEEFAWRLDLPPAGSSARFGLQWAEHATVERYDDLDAVVVRSLDDVVPLRLGTFVLVGAVVGPVPRTRVLAGGPHEPVAIARTPVAVWSGPGRSAGNVGTVDQLLDVLEAHVRGASGEDDLRGVDVRQDLRDVFDSLLASRALWLRPA